MNRPQPDEYGEFYKGYIDSVSDDVMTELETQATEISAFFRSIPKEKADYAYAEGKWTFIQLLGHFIETERIMAYRLLRISRNDSTPLPGFEENDFVKYSNFSDQDFGTLIDEFEAVRKANLFLVKSLSEEQLDRRGTASGLPISVRALLFIMAGHAKHHCKVAGERYL